MRYQPTTIVMCLALGVLAPGCDESPEDPIGAAWIPDDDENEDDGVSGTSGASDDGASSWGDGGDASDGGETSAGGSAGDDSGGDDSAGDDSAGDDSAGDDSAGDDSAGETSGGDPGAGGDSPYAGGWDVGACDDASGPGDTIVGTDQHGENVYLRDFCHKAVLFVLGNFT